MAIKIWRPSPIISGMEEMDKASILKAFEYAIANGATVSSNSYGLLVSTSTLNQLKNQYTNIANNNPQHLFVFASGNSQTSVNGICKMEIPAFICVAASTSADSKASSSSTDKNLVHVFAPGEGIKSTNNGKWKYSKKSGTSFAAPFVSGLAALIMSIKTMTAIETKNYILDNVQVKSQYANYVSSSGLLDAYATINAVIGEAGEFLFFFHDLACLQKKLFCFQLPKGVQIGNG